MPASASPWSAWGSIVVLVVVLVGLVSGGGETASSSPVTETVWGEATPTSRLIAVPVTGVILGGASDGATFGGSTYGYEVADTIDALEADDADGLILELNTPGGTIYGSRAIADAVERYQERTGHQVMAHVQGMSASGGVYAMAGADQIVADHGSLVGSIGVVMGPVPALPRRHGHPGLAAGAGRDHRGRHHPGVPDPGPRQGPRQPLPRHDPVPGQFIDEVVLSGGLTFPTSFEFLPDGRMLVTEFQGRILIAQAGANVVDSTPVITIPNFFNEDVTVGGERGLVNVVADPDFEENGYIYAFYTAASPRRDRVARFTIVGNTAAPASEFIVWQGQRPHRAQTITAAASLSDRTASSISRRATSRTAKCPSPSPRSRKNPPPQQRRLVPVDNPFCDGPGPNIDGIWARGLRNPYRFSFDSVSGAHVYRRRRFNTVEEVNAGCRRCQLRMADL